MDIPQFRVLNKYPVCGIEFRIYHSAIGAYPYFRTGTILKIE